MHKVLLIEPPFYRLFKDTYSLTRFPLSLGYLSGAIMKDTGWRVMAYNADFNPNEETMKVSYQTGRGFYNYRNNLQELSAPVWGEVKATIDEFRPAVVAISVKAQNFASARIVARIAKNIDNKTVIIIGGPHATMARTDSLAYPEIDLCVKGEGEKTIVELLTALETGRKFEGIPGIIYRKDGRIVENAPRELTKDLDTLSFPHEIAPAVLKDFSLYPRTAFQSIFAIRGCPHNCFFCASREVWGRKERYRSPANVAREIQGLQKMGSRHVHFDDDTFGVNHGYIKDLCNAMIENCPGITWGCEIRVDLIDEPTVSMMKKAGCDFIQVGIESGNNGILSSIRKGITVEQALTACRIIKKHGIRLLTFWVIGFPWETEETLIETVAAMKKSGSDTLCCSIFDPYQYTEAFEFCKERGLIAKDYDGSLHNHLSPDNCFCVNIPPQKFRMLASKIEKMVDRKNFLKRLKGICMSMDIIKKIYELGMKGFMLKGMKILMCK